MCLTSESLFQIARHQSTVEYVFHRYVYTLRFFVIRNCMFHNFLTPHFRDLLKELYIKKHFEQNTVATLSFLFKLCYFSKTKGIEKQLK